MRSEWRRATGISGWRFGFLWFIRAERNLEQGWRYEHHPQRKPNSRYVQIRLQRLIREEELEKSESKQ
jgi:hypothetical protein